MKPIKIAGLFILMFQASLAHAISKEGHGGKVIVCPTSSQTEKVLDILDYYEAKLKGYAIDLGPKTLSLDQKIGVALSRLERFQPKRTQRYRDFAKKILSDLARVEHGGNGSLIFMQNDPIKDSPDSFEEFLPSCEGGSIQQVILQRAPRFPEERLFTIYKKLWKSLTLDQKAGLILHEMIYNEAIELGQEDSIRTRYFNGRISSPSFDELNINQCYRLSILVGLPMKIESVPFGGVVLAGDGISFYEGTDIPKGGTVISGALTFPDGRTREIKQGTISFDKSGQMKCFNSGFNYPESLKIFGITIPSSPYNLLSYCNQQDGTYISIQSSDFSIDNPYKTERASMVMIFAVGWDIPELSTLPKNLIHVQNAIGDGIDHGFKVGKKYYKSVAGIFYDAATEKVRALRLWSDDGYQYVCFDEKNREMSCL